MDSSRPALVVLLSLSLSSSVGAQQPPPRDSQALLILQQSLAAMGGVAPSDSVATGNVEIVAGSKRENGTIRILARGLDQTAETIQTSDGSRAVIYSRGRANEIEGTAVKSLQLELVVTSPCPDFPLPLLAAVLNNADAAAQYLGLETLNGVAVHHIRLWNTFSSRPGLQKLADFSVKDLWVDAASGLPRKVSFDRRAARGSAGHIPVEILYSYYRNVGGVFYPFLVNKSLNGTPWATITIVNVAFNTGLTEADFPVR